MSAQDIVKTHYDTFNSRAWGNNAKNYVDPSAVIADVTNGVEVHGIDGYQGFSATWVAAFPDAHVNIVNQEVAGDTVTTTFRGTGTFTGTLQTPDGPIPGNGRKLNLEFQEQVEVRNNKIIRAQLDYDPQEMMRQLGLG